jgi:hypothetical protein
MFVVEGFIQSKNSTLGFVPDLATVDEESDCTNEPDETEVFWFGWRGQ